MTKLPKDVEERFDKRFKTSMPWIIEDNFKNLKFTAGDIKQFLAQELERAKK